MKARVPKTGQGVNQAGMMKQIQKMQEDMEAKQAEVQETEFNASAGGGAVEVVLNGAHEVKSINSDSPGQWKPGNGSWPTASLCPSLGSEIRGPR